MIIMFVCWWILRWQGSVRNAISQVSWWFRDPAVAKQFQLTFKAVIFIQLFVGWIYIPHKCRTFFQQQMHPRKKLAWNFTGGPLKKEMTDSMFIFGGVSTVYEGHLWYSYHRWWSDPLATLISRWKKLLVRRLKKRSRMVSWQMLRSMIQQWQGAVAVCFFVVYVWFVWPIDRLVGEDDDTGTVPSWELTCPHPRHVWRWFSCSFPKVGYVNSLKGTRWDMLIPWRVL